MGRVCQKSSGEQRETSYAVLNVVYAVVYYINSIDAVKTMTIIFALILMVSNDFSKKPDGYGDLDVKTLGRGYAFGKPVVFLHADTASSKMFELFLPLYTDTFKAILIDFLESGKSDGVEGFQWTYGKKQTRPLHCWSIYGV